MTTGDEGLSTRRSSDPWMAGLTRNRVSSAGESRPIIRNEQRGKGNREHSAKPVISRVYTEVQPVQDHSLCD